MPIKIHHGPPGAYKTSGAIGDDFLREAREGRVIVTNVRGVSRERTLELFPDLPKTFDVIFVDDKTKEGREQWAKWFHWVPLGAFLFIDEVQDIWPKSWREADIRRLDYPGGVEEAAKAGRPKDWEQALDKHRHFNWDMTLTCPAYSKVRDDVKSIADAAYKHKNLALIGWTGRYIEAMHLADDTGKNASDFMTVVNKKVPKYVFDLYDSTQTGVISDTKSGFNLFKSPRVVILLSVLCVVGYFVLSRPLPAVIGGSAKASDALNTVGGKAASADTGKGGAVAPAAGVPFVFNQDVRAEPFVEGEPRIILSYKIGARWKYAVRHNQQDWTTEDLLEAGYAVTGLGSCALRIAREEFSRVVVCGIDDKNPTSPATSESGATARSGVAPDSFKLAQQ